jgi:hypothetical protein
LQQPKFQSPKKNTNPHFDVQNPLLFTKLKISHFKVVYSPDVLKSFLTTPRKEHTLIKLQPKTSPEKTGLGSLVWNLTQEASHSTLIHARWKP